MHLTFQNARYLVWTIEASLNDQDFKDTPKM